MVSSASCIESKMMNKKMMLLSLLSLATLAGCESDPDAPIRRRAEVSPVDRGSASGEIMGNGQYNSGVGAPIIVGEFGNGKDQPARVRTPLGDLEEKPKAAPAPAASQPAQNALPITSPRGFSDGTK